LYFRHDPEWRRFVEDTRTAGLRWRLAVESPAQLEVPLLQLAISIDARAGDPDTSIDNPGDTFWQRVTASRPWMEELPAPVTALYRNLDPSLDWSMAGSWRPTLQELLAAARQRTTTEAERRAALLTGFHSWLDEHVDGFNGNAMGKGGGERLLLHRVRLAADVFQNLTPGPAIRAFFDHVVCGADLHGPPVTVRPSYTSAGEPSITLELTSSSLTQRLASEVADEFPTLAAVAGEHLGAAVKRGDMMHAARVHAILLLESLIAWHSPEGLSPTTSDAAKHWNALAGPNGPKIDLRNVAMRVRTYRPPLDAIVLNAHAVFDMSGPHMNAIASP
jgi:hypothetical protein